MKLSTDQELAMVALLYATRFGRFGGENQQGWGLDIDVRLYPIKKAGTPIYVITSHQLGERIGTHLYKHIEGLAVGDALAWAYEISGQVHADLKRRGLVTTSGRLTPKGQREAKAIAAARVLGAL